MGRLEEDFNGVIVGSALCKGATNASKVGEWIDAPTNRFGMDSGEVETRLIKYLLGKGIIGA